MTQMFLLVSNVLISSDLPCLVLLHEMVGLEPTAGSD